MGIHHDFITAFLTKWERRKLQGYVPCRPGGNYIGSGSYVGCDPIMSSGVTIGTGVDLGQQTEAYLTSIGISVELVDKLRPYLGKRRHDALEVLYQKPLYITDAECDALDTAIHTDYTERVAKLYDSTIVILTTGRPYLAQGSVPESLQLVHLPIEQACVSAHSVGFLPGGIVYASPDGLMLFTSNEQTLLTGGVYTREQWQALHPENLLGAVLDDRYVGFFRGTNTGFILDLNRRDIVRVAFADGSQVNGLYHHSNDDCLYLAFQTGGKCGACRFEDGEPLAYTWRSKLFFTSTLTGLSAVRVEGEQKTGQPVLVKVFGPRMDRPKCRVRLTEDRTRRLPLVRSEKIWCVELSGTSPVHELRLGSSVEDLEHGN